MKKNGGKIIELQTLKKEPTSRPGKSRDSTGFISHIHKVSLKSEEKDRRFRLHLVTLELRREIKVE